MLRKAILPIKPAALALAGLVVHGLPSPAESAEVQMAGKLGQKALLVIDGAPPKWFEAGQRSGPVRLIRLEGDMAIVEVEGLPQQLRVGDAPVHVSGKTAPGGDERIVLTADEQGHYQQQGAIDGKSIRFMVDTGATSVVISEAAARTMGLKINRSQPVQINTANGSAMGYMVTFRQVQIGNVKLRDVEGVIIPKDMPFALLGNSFLKRVDMRQNAGQMTLEKRF